MTPYSPERKDSSASLAAHSGAPAWTARTMADQGKGTRFASHPVETVAAATRGTSAGLGRSSRRTRSARPRAAACGHSMDYWAPVEQRPDGAAEAAPWM